MDSSAASDVYKRQAWNDTVALTLDSVQVAPFLHGLLLHSFTSMSQLPVSVELCVLSATVHSVVYSLMKLYAHAPLA